MKKFLLVLAIGAFASCGGGSSTENKDSSAAKAMDTTSAKVDTMKASVDSTKAKVDSLKKDTTTKK